jgi:hypothetical protein
MTTTTLNTNVSGAAAPFSFLKLGGVQDDLMAQLREHGMHCPMRGIRDPRLAHPELLLSTGWKRETTEEGYGYRYVVHEERGLRWEQFYEKRDDGCSILVTRAGTKEQTVKEDACGTITSRVSFLN